MVCCFTTCFVGLLRRLSSNVKDKEQKLGNWQGLRLMILRQDARDETG